MKKLVLFVLTVLAVTALVLVLSPVSARADVDVFPTGTYATTITAADVAGLPPFFQDLLIGDWEMIYKEDGSFEVHNLTTRQSAQGKYVVNPAVVVFAGKDTGQLACLGAGVYKWTAPGNSLTFTAVSDQCLGRFIVFTSHPLTKQP
jgi:hypothetical protein